jgi:hypothetical protein
MERRRFDQPLRPLAIGTLAVVLVAAIPELPAAAAASGTGWVVTRSAGSVLVPAARSLVDGTRGWVALAGPAISWNGPGSTSVASGTAITLRLPTNFRFDTYALPPAPAVSPVSCGLTVDVPRLSGVEFGSSTASVALQGTPSPGCVIDFESSLHVQPVYGDPSAGSGGPILASVGAADLGQVGHVQLDGPDPAARPADLILSTRGGHGPIVNDAIQWGSQIILTTMGPPGTRFALQVSTDQVTWTSVAHLTIDANGRSRQYYTPVRNYWYRAVPGSEPDNRPRVVVRQYLRFVTPSVLRNGWIRRGTSVTFRTLTRPARPELPPAIVRFVLFRVTTDGAVPAATADVTNDAGGRAEFSHRFDTPGQWTVRAQALPTAVNANSNWLPSGTPPDGWQFEVR